MTYAPQTAQATPDTSVSGTDFEIAPTIGVLRELLDDAAIRKEPADVRARMAETLELLETLTGWSTGRASGRLISRVTPAQVSPLARRCSSGAV